MLPALKLPQPFMGFTGTSHHLSGIVFALIPLAVERLLGCCRLQKRNQETVSPVPSVLPRWPMDDGEERWEMSVEGAVGDWSVRQ